MKYCYCKKCGKHEENDHDEYWFHCDCKDKKREKNWIDKALKKVRENGE